MRIGFLVYDDVQALDLFGPMDAFAEANHILAGKRQHYELLLVSAGSKSVQLTNGTRVDAHYTIDDCPTFDTLIIPGGVGSRAEDFPSQAIEWIRRRAPSLRRYGSVCTGLYILAKTGLLDGLRATTHWHHAADAQEQFPKIRIQPDILFARCGKAFSAAGVTAGIDLALSLIEEDLGPSAASDVARYMVVFLKRPGDQRQFSGLLQQQFAADGEFGDLLAWIADNLEGNLNSHILAGRVGLSERQFRRRFTHLVGRTPTQHIAELRIEASKNGLKAREASINTIARTCGFESADTFRRAFERHTGISPSTYRERFRATH